jgi:hypothetical protein
MHSATRPPEADHQMANAESRSIGVSPHRRHQSLFLDLK